MSIAPFPPLRGAVQKELTFLADMSVRRGEGYVYDLNW